MKKLWVLYAYMLISTVIEKSMPPFDWELLAKTCSGGVGSPHPTHAVRFGDLTAQTVFQCGVGNPFPTHSGSQEGVPDCAKREPFQVFASETKQSPTIITV
jgi:hypothetical protein